MFKTPEFGNSLVDRSTAGLIKVPGSDKVGGCISEVLVQGKRETEPVTTSHLEIGPLAGELDFVSWVTTSGLTRLNLSFLVGFNKTSSSE